MFYQSIATVYDYIFPQNKKQLEFIDNVSPIKKGSKVLDIGCATGNLTSLLQGRSIDVTGIDLDTELLAIAKSKYNNINFKQGNMLTLKDNFEVNTFDKVVSFGNTLVHLPSREDVKDYFEQVYNLLVDSGEFIVQIINYDRIINQDIHNLSTIDNDKLTFIRNYILHDGYVDFATKLIIKENGQVIENSIPLLALKQEEIKVLLQEAGFDRVDFYGGLNGGKVGEDSIPLLFLAKK